MSFKSKAALAGILFLTVLPIVELTLLIEVGRRIGTWWTVGIVIGTGVLGGSLLVSEGAGVIANAKREMEQGKIPKNEIIDGVLIVIGSLLLITPGLITDTLGLLLLVPVTRIPFNRMVKRCIGQYIYIDL